MRTRWSRCTTRCLRFPKLPSPSPTRTTTSSISTSKPSMAATSDCSAATRPRAPSRPSSPRSASSRKDPSCASAQGTSPDAVFDFTVTGTGTRRIRVETFDGFSGSSESTTNKAGFQHLVAVVERPLNLTANEVSVSGNDTIALARVVPASSIPVSLGSWTRFSGTLVGANADVLKENLYSSSNADTATCSNVQSANRTSCTASTWMPPTSAATTSTPSNRLGTTALSLHRDAVDVYSKQTTAFAVAATNTDARAGQALGDINGRSVIRVTGGNTNAAGVTNKWTRKAQTATASDANGCRRTTTPPATPRRSSASPFT